MNTIDQKIHELLPLVKKLAGQYHHAGISYDDLVQEGTIGVWEAWQRFDENKGAQFSTYAVYWIKKRMLALVDREIRQPEHLSEEAHDQIAAPSPNPTNLQLRFPPNFPRLEKEILIMSYQEELSLGDIANSLQLPRERVRQLRAKAIRRLKIALQTSDKDIDDFFHSSS